MLFCVTVSQPCFLPLPHLPQKNNPPDLQRARAQDAGLFVLGHKGGGGALVVGDLLVLVRLVVPLAGVGRRVGVARRDDVVLVLPGLPLVLRRARRLVLVGRFRFRLVVLIGVLVEGGLVITRMGWIG